MVYTANLGYPRIGLKREIKKALEAYWGGKISAEELLATGRSIRKYNWELQKGFGLDFIPSNDFSFYDHVLDTSLMLGIIPRRFVNIDGLGGLDLYFSMARGRVVENGEDIPAMEMTKWFNTNYHYIVPEIEKGMQISLSSLKPVEDYLEAKNLGIETRPVLLGPVTFLLLSKSFEGIEPLSMLEKILPVYAEVLQRLHKAGAEWVQIDEPYLVLDLNEEVRQAFVKAYKTLSKTENRSKMILTSYFGSVADQLNLLASLPVEGIHLDLSSSENYFDLSKHFLKFELLSLGVVNARNIWKAELDVIVKKLKNLIQHFGPERLVISPSGSLMHIPQDVNLETDLDEEVKSWLSFACQKLEEVRVIAAVINEGDAALQSELEKNRQVFLSKKNSTRIHNPEVQERMKNITPEMESRQSDYSRREEAQKSIGLPLFPTTTIGSFPQTKEVRLARAKFTRGEISLAEYEEFLKEETKKTIRFQEEIGLDVLVHGEFERNDMVQYFAEQMEGFLFTRQGWVQSYGSRYVRPPVIFGDVSRPQPMTVRWAEYAQSLTEKPVKGMLTGPVTILQWSFVRDDQPRKETCKQIALAIRDEVVDLEKAGIQIIQIDEPAFREGLPLKRAEWQDYLDWAVESFHLSANGVKDETQIHTHMCYSEFNHIMGSVAAMDADVISIEASRSKMELLDSFVNFEYPNQIGPGVYDIHSPLVPEKDEMKNLLEKAVGVLKTGQVWVNPDCGLKTRNWEEVKPALTSMVEAAREMRSEE